MRLFIATTFPADILRDVNDRLARIKGRLGNASWVRPESQHLTFAFLGEQGEELVDRLTTALEERVASLHSFEARLQGAGFFPNSRNARVAWIGVAPSDRFGALAAAARSAAADVGIELDGAEFRAHMTLGRIRDRWPPACVDAFQQVFSRYESAPFTLGEVTLFASELKPSGAVHTALRRVPLR